MPRYIDKFQTTGDVQTALDNGTLGTGYVAYVSGNDSLDFNTLTPTIDYSTLYFTIKVTSQGYIVWNPNMKDVYYSKDYGYTWTGIRGGETILANVGDTIYLKITKTPSSLGGGISGSTAGFSVEGNIMSLLYGDNFSGQTTIPSENMFEYFFYNCTGLTSAENLILPSTTLIAQCYSCMFWGCTSLTTAPVLPATTLLDGCYYQMFRNCSSLNYVKCLATTDMDFTTNSCTSQWLYGVASTGTFIKASGSSWWEDTDNGIPENWTVITAS